jgi:crooked neck
LAKAIAHFKDNEPDLKEERLMLLENWLQIEQRAGSDQVEQVKAKFPKRVKKRRKVKVVDSATGQDVTDEGDEGWEEYYDYVFPEDGPTGPVKNLKILQMAHKWKEQAS